MITIKKNQVTLHNIVLIQTKITKYLDLKITFTKKKYSTIYNNIMF